jgi:hypothetical protein
MRSSRVVGSRETDAAAFKSVIRMSGGLQKPVRVAADALGSILKRGR